MELQDRQTFICLEPFLSCRVMLCFMQEAQKDNPHLGQAHCLVNGENLVLHVVHNILVSYQRVKYLKYDHVRRKWYKNQFKIKRLNVSFKIYYRQMSH